MVNPEPLSRPACIVLVNGSKVLSNNSASMPLPVSITRAQSYVHRKSWPKLGMCSAQLPALQQTQVFRSAFVDYLRVLTIFFSTLGVNCFNSVCARVHLSSAFLANRQTDMRIGCNRWCWTSNSCIFGAGFQLYDDLPCDPDEPNWNRASRDDSPRRYCYDNLFPISNSFSRTAEPDHRAGHWSGFCTFSIGSARRRRGRRGLGHSEHVCSR